jgi:hypothetical protein
MIFISFFFCYSVQKYELNFVPTTPNPAVEYNYGPRSVAVGYFNNNTWLDIVVANDAVHYIAVFFGYGNGTFASQMMYAIGDGSSSCMATAGDFNNDDRSNIAVANFGTNNIRIFLRRNYNIRIALSRPFCTISE